MQLSNTVGILTGAARGIGVSIGERGPYGFLKREATGSE